MFTKVFQFGLARFVLMITLILSMQGLRPIQPVLAKTLTVTNTNDSGTGSLRQAIADAASGDTITFNPSLSGQMMTLETSLIIDKDLTIDASVLSSQITISGVTTQDGTGNNHVFIIKMNRKVILKDLTITKSEVTGYVYNGGIMIENDAMLTITGCAISNFTGDSGVTNWYGTLTMMNSSVLNNSSASGGGLYNRQGTAVLTNVVISNNSASSTTGGAGIYNDGDMTITGSTISNNSGGGIRNDRTLTLTDSTVTGNSDGGIYNDLGYYGTSMTIANSTISNNVGGGIENLGPATVTDSTFEGNSADYGAGIYNTSTLTITNSTFSNNQASSSGYGDGGGIDNEAGILSIQNSTFSGNTAANGGGIYNGGDGVVTINNSAVYDNHAHYGGGVYNHGDMALNNTTISNNIASVGTPPYYNDGHGGGIYSGYGGSNLTLNHTTVTDNSSNFVAGGIYYYGFDSIKIHNSILANNIASTYSNDCNGNITSLGYNLIGDDRNCDFVAATGDLVGTSPEPINPRLGPLQNNGGPTPTMALLAGSPAINAGDNSTCASDPVSNLDQRGVARPEGRGCEIGAYEVDIPIVASVTRVNQNPTTGSVVDFRVTFSETVNGVDTVAPFNDFTLTTTGITGASIMAVSGSGDTYTVTASTGTGGGKIHLDIVDDDSIKDASDNPLGGVGIGNGNFTGGQSYIKTITGTFRSVAAQDGWILESAETSNRGGSINAAATTLLLGDSATRQQYRAILSFNTASLPDNAVITKIVLKIKRQSVTGTNPFTTHLKIAVDIRKGAFGNNAALQPADFQAAATRPGVGLLANNPQPGGWYVANLKITAYPYIDRAGITQLRLRFQTGDDNDAVADFFRFFSGNAIAANRPVLVIEYYVP